MANANHGLHILAGFTAPAMSLSEMEGCREFLSDIVQGLGLELLADIYQPFASGGFTAMLCLAAGQLVLHTSPDDEYATTDIFLYGTDASLAGRLYNGILHYFEAAELNRKDIER